MNICGMSLIPIFITILCCGAVFVYFNMRLAEVKSAVEKQNRVLTAFITNVQTDIQNGGTIMGVNVMGAGTSTLGTGTMGTGATTFANASVIGANHFASEEALQAINGKIVVSDDDDDSESEDSSDDESNTSSDSEDDEPRAIEFINLNEDSLKVQDAQVQEVHVQDVVPVQEVHVQVQDVVPVQEVQVQVQDVQVQVQDVQVQVQDVVPVQVQDLVGAQDSAISVECVSLDLISGNLTLEFEQDNKAYILYEQMKVDDLRKVVLDLNLAGKDEAKKLKKPELLILLKNKKN
jgi:hypothetical protein